MIIRRDQANEHWTSNQGDWYQTSWKRYYPNRAETYNPRRVTGWETADIISALEGMESVRTCIDERRIIMPPRLRPVTANHITEAITELIRHDYAEARQEQGVLPSRPRCPRAPEAKQGKDKRRPRLQFRRRISQPTKSATFSIAWS